MKILWALLVVIWFIGATAIFIDLLNNKASVDRLKAAAGAIYPAYRMKRR